MPRNTNYIPAGADQEKARIAFGERLRVRMNQMGWSQSELARRAGVKRDRVSNYIRGNTWPDPDNLSRLAEALTCEPGDLVPTIGESQEDSAGSPISMSVGGGTDRIHLRISKQVTMSQASRILAILEEKNERAVVNPAPDPVTADKKPRPKSTPKKTKR